MPTPTAPAPPDGPLAELAGRLLREVLPSDGKKLLKFGDPHLRLLETEIDDQAGESAAKELAKKLLDHLQATSPYAPWQRVVAESNHHNAAVNEEVEAFNDQPWRKRVLAIPPDRESILKRIIREAIAKLARAVVKFCRRALGLDIDRPPLPACRPSPPLPAREPRREPTPGR